MLDDIASGCLQGVVEAVCEATVEHILGPLCWGTGWVVLKTLSMGRLRIAPRKTAAFVARRGLWVEIEGTRFLRPAVTIGVGLVLWLSAIGALVVWLISL